MPNIQEAVGAIFREIARTVEALPEDEVRDWLAGNTRPVLTFEPSGTGRRSKGGREDIRPLDLDALIEQLSSAVSVEEAFATLRSAHLPKSLLQQLARKLDLPTPRTDSLDRVESRIIDATVGFRTRSRAIQGEHVGPSRHVSERSIGDSRRGADTSNEVAEELRDSPYNGRSVRVAGGDRADTFGRVLKTNIVYPKNGPPFYSFLVQTGASALYSYGTSELEFIDIAPPPELPKPNDQM